MARLIDADALIERKFVLHNIEDMTNEEFENLVNTQPKAYDVEKVVEEIKEYSMRTFGEIRTENTIDIVRRGGVNE